VQENNCKNYQELIEPGQLMIWNYFDTEILVLVLRKSIDKEEFDYWDVLCCLTKNSPRTYIAKSSELFRI
jgi:hypothetical protein